MLKLLAHMLWPVSCPVCGALGELLCEPCLRSLLKPQLPRCLWCGENIPCKVHGGNAHKDDSSAAAKKIYSAALYEGHMKGVILALKYGGYKALGPILGSAMADFLPRPNGIDVLIPVPLHLKSKRRYNQALAIASGLGRAWGIEVLDAARWTSDVASRAGLGASERQSLQSGAFAFGTHTKNKKNIKNISGLRVGFVDDVCTTGSTLAAIAQAARLHGAEAVCAFAAAQVPPFA